MRARRVIYAALAIAVLGGLWLARRPEPPRPVASQPETRSFVAALPARAPATDAQVTVAPAPTPILQPTPEQAIAAPPLPSVSYRVTPRIPKADLTEAASDDDGAGKPALVEVPMPRKRIPAPPPGPEPKPNPAVRDPNATYRGEGARDDDGG